ncbi:Uncharacterised protein [Vibrio cholerae]|nr:Uncharacterised protein [Vibrio cholerae]CSH91833.1 Uncharacterised protein [Vibrio cholerae]CSI47062.1 Uncharacterised protein [Vibrio cholerae]
MGNRNCQPHTEHGGPEGLIKAELGNMPIIGILPDQIQIERWRLPEQRR